MSLMPTAASAEGAEVISLRTDVSQLDIHDTFTVTVEAKNLSGLYASDIRLTFDSNKVKYVSTKNGLTSGFHVSPIEEEGSTLILAHTLLGQHEGFTGDKLLYTLTFEAIGSGQTEVSLAAATIVDAEGMTKESTLGDNVSVTISSQQGSEGDGGDPSDGENEEETDEESEEETDEGTDEPEIGTGESEVTVEPELDEQGTASATVTEDVIEEAIRRAQDRTLAFALTPVEGAKKMQIDIPLRPIVSDEEGTIDSIKVDTGFATVSVSTKLWTTNQEGEAQPAKLEISVAKVDDESLPAGVRDKLQEGTTVYDFNLSLDGNKISKFQGNEVKVEVPYTLKPGEKPNKIVIYYIDDEGNLEVVKNGKFNPETGRVEFKPKHFSKYAAAFADVTFEDIAGVVWALDAIESLAARDIVHGIGNDQFDPEGKVTRAEFITMLINAFDLHNPNATTALTDVQAGAWYYNAVASAQELGIVNGHPDRTFGIHASISREDMAVMIYRIMLLMDVQWTQQHSEASFADLASISGYALEAVDVMHKAEIIQGVGDGRFAPKADSTRAEAAVMINRLLNAEKE